MPRSIPDTKPSRLGAAFPFAILLGLLATGTTRAQSETSPLTLSPAASSPDTSSPRSNPQLALEYRPDASSVWTGAGTGLLWSVGATVLPVWAGVEMLNASNSLALPGVFMLLGGLAAGPSAGQWSLGSGLQGGLGTLIRVPGMLLVFAGVAQSIGSAFCGMDFSGDSDASQCPEDDGSGKIKTGMYIYLIGTAYSLIDIPFAARRRQERQSRYGFAPFLLPGAGGGTSQGLMAWTRF